MNLVQILAKGANFRIYGTGTSKILSITEVKTRTITQDQFNLLHEHGDIPTTA